MPNPDIGYMTATLRGRCPPVCGLTSRHAGNYEVLIPLFRGDYEAPELIRRAVRQDDTGEFRAQRGGKTEIPGLCRLLFGRMASVTNWAGLYKV